MRRYWVYILASRSGVLYVGVTNDLNRRLEEHRSGEVIGFTSRYHVKKLVYTESSVSAIDAIEREKQIKRWRREKKVALINSVNPEWEDLSDEIGAC